MGGKKATKKFVKKHLSGQIEKRKHAKKIGGNTKPQRHDGRGGGGDDRAPKSKTAQAKDNAIAAEKPAVKKDWTEMDFEQFMASGAFEKALEAEEGEEAEGLDSDVDGEEDGADDDDIKADWDNEEDGDEKEEEEGEGDENEEDEEEEIETHKKQLELLKKTDPDFIKHLEQAEPDLLAFGEDENEGEGAGEGEEGEEVQQEAAAAKVKSRQLTPAVLERLKKTAEKSPMALKRLVMAFRSACRVGTESDDQNDSGADYRIASSDVFNDLMVFVLENVDRIFNAQLGRSDEDVKAHKRLTRRGPKWDKFQPIIKSYVANLTHLMTNVTEAKMLSFILNHSIRSIQFVGVFQQVAPKFLRTLVKLWSTSEDLKTRILAFLNIREMAVAMPYPYLHTVMKHVYIAFVRNSNFTNAKTMPTIAFMMNSVVEIFSMDPPMAYQHAFSYIRELAVMLRKALNEQTRESYRKVYNWQYMNSLRVWAQLVCSAPHEKDLQMLAYPILQLLYGVMSLVPTGAYFPLRFHCIRLINDLAAAAEVLASPVPYLLEVLDSAQLTRKPKLVKSTDSRPIDLQSTLKVPKGYLNTRTYQESVFNQVVFLLTQHFAQNTYSIAFPELAVPTVVFLKKWMKNCRVANYRRSIGQLLEKVETQSNWILQRRNKVDFSPADLDKSKQFLSEEKSAHKAPLDIYFRDFAKRQSDLRSKTDFRVVDQEVLDNSEDEAEEQEEEGGGEEDEDEEDEEKAEKNSKKSNKKEAKNKKQEKSKKRAADEDQVDVVATKKDKKPKKEESKQKHNGVDSKKDKKKKKKMEKNKGRKKEKQSPLAGIPDQEDVIEKFTLSDEDDD